MTLTFVAIVTTLVLNFFWYFIPTSLIFFNFFVIVFILASIPFFCINSIASYMYPDVCCIYYVYIGGLSICLYFCLVDRDSVSVTQPSIIR